MRLIDADALIASMGLQDCKKYGNKTQEEMLDSYGLMPRYEIKAMIDAEPTVEAKDVKTNAVKRKTYISIRCDICYAGEDLLDNASIQEIWKAYRELGWTGTIRRCYCPKCSAELAAKKI